VGARYGDGIEQEGEDCDDGNRFDGDGCGSACRNVVVK
jgi:cysteine-rich repeat protein